MTVPWAEEEAPQIIKMGSVLANLKGHSNLTPSDPPSAEIPTDPMACLVDMALHCIYFKFKKKDLLK